MWHSLHGGLGASRRCMAQPGRELSTVGGRGGTGWEGSDAGKGGDAERGKVEGQGRGGWKGEWEMKLCWIEIRENES